MIVVGAEFGAEQLKQAVPRGCRLRTVPSGNGIAESVEHQPALDRDPEVMRHESMPILASAARISGCVMMPAPRPRSGTGERSKISTLPATLAQVERAEQPAHGAADDGGTAPFGSHVLHHRLNSHAGAQSRIANQSTLLQYSPDITPTSVLQKPHRPGGIGPCLVHRTAAHCLAQSIPVCAPVGRLERLARATGRFIGSSGQRGGGWLAAWRLLRRRDDWGLHLLRHARCRQYRTSCLYHSWLLPRLSAQSHVRIGSDLGRRDHAARPFTFSA